MADQTAVPAPSGTPPVSPPVVPAAPPAATPTAAVVEEDEKFFAALGYFGPLFVIPLVVKPKSAFCKFHAKQSMVLFLIFFVFLVVLFSIHWLGSLLTLPLFAVYIIAIYKSYHGEIWNIPVVSQFAGKMNVEALYSKAGLAVSSLSGLKEKAEGLAQKAGQAVQNLGKQEGPTSPPEASSPAAPPAPAPPPATPPAAPPVPPSPPSA